MQLSRLSGLTLAFVAAMILPALALRAAPLDAAAGETAHLKLGIVGVDELSRAGVGRGVRVTELLGPRWMRGDLRRGDVVLWLDGRRVRDGEELADALVDLGDGSFSVGVLRRGQLREVQLPRERRWKSGVAILEDRRGAIRDVLRDVQRDIRRDGRDVRRDVARDVRRDVRDVMRDVRRDVIRDVHRLRHDVVLRRGDRAEFRDAMRRLGERLRELERLEAEDWR